MGARRLIVVKQARAKTAKASKASSPLVSRERVMSKVCARIAAGESLRTICADEAMPGMSTVMEWLAADAALADQYARARATQAEAMFEGMVALADNSDPAEAQKVRVQIDTRKWVLARMFPRKYGDRMDVTTDGEKLPGGGVVVVIPDNGRGDRRDSGSS